jgi:hypothetical protein
MMVFITSENRSIPPHGTHTDTSLERRDAGDRQGPARVFPPKENDFGFCGLAVDHVLCVVR